MELNKRQERTNNILYFFIAFCLFAGCTILHIILGDFPKAIDILPDERRYIEIARSLFAGNGLIIRGEVSNFQKILYPISLFPAMSFPDPIIQVKVINILNSIYASLSVFPGLLLAKKLFKKPSLVILSMIIVIITPDLMASMSFMTEPLYMPLALFMIYACWCTFESSGTKQLILSFICGLLCYAVYLCKEVAWMFLIAFVALYIINMIKRRKTIREGIGSIILIGAGFFIPFIIMKMTLFAGLNNSYSQFSFDILLAPYTIFFAFYSLGMDFTFFVVGFGFFPVVYLFFTLKDASNKDRDFALFCLMSLLVGLACVIFTISMREDVGHIYLRQHLRYVAPLIIPLTFLFIKQGPRFNIPELKKNPRRYALVISSISAFCVLTIMFIGQGNLSQGFDYSQFHLYRKITEMIDPLKQEYFESALQTISGIKSPKEPLLNIHPVNWIFRFLIVAYIIVGSYFLLKDRRSTRRKATYCITAVIMAAMLANSVTLAIHNHKSGSVEEADIIETATINDQLKAIKQNEPDANIVIILDNDNTGPNAMIDTYIQDPYAHYHYYNTDVIKNKLTAARGQSLNGLNIDYLLSNSNQDVSAVTQDAELIGGDDSPYSKNPNPGKMTFSLYKIPIKEKQFILENVGEQIQNKINGGILSNTNPLDLNQGTLSSLSTKSNESNEEASSSHIAIEPIH